MRYHICFGLASASAIISLSSPATALQCHIHNVGVANCSTEGSSDVCYVNFYTEETIYGGCLPDNYYTVVAEQTGCVNASLCYCHTDMCNTEDWARSQRPESCYGGVIGYNMGQECTDSKLSAELKPAEPRPVCNSRAYVGCRLDNNDDYSHDETCSGLIKTACDANTSCKWSFATANQTESCIGSDGLCNWNGTLSTCTDYEGRSAAEKLYYLQRGMSCSSRLETGCRYTYNQTQGDVGDPYELPTIGEGTIYDGKRCRDISNELECTAHQGGCENGNCANCTWITLLQDDPEYTCENKGAGTYNETLCSYTDGVGPPPESIVEMAFISEERTPAILARGPNFVDKCTMIATFRNGSGSAVSLEANTAGTIQSNCEDTKLWGLIGVENTGHNKTTIAEYCENFVPEPSVMNGTLSLKSPGAIIAEVKAGKFISLFPAFEDLRYIVTSKPEFGECLFTAKAGEWGLAICTCDTHLCNNETSLMFVVNPDEGPMRLIQFIDGSLKDMADAINEIVPGLMDENGIFVQSKAGTVTEADVDKIMLLDGAAEKTTAEELWGLIQDYQKLNAFIAQGGDPNDPPLGSGSTNDDNAASQDANLGMFAASLIAASLISTLWLW